ncbi:unnamed protein product, partial [Mesorhabditis belari]|uniref:NADAR domain-containing protein n=1 Tax=Mesorhabditis belari TaxID=2138241 RepID=A0AAF3EGU9_9BILA
MAKSKVEQDIDELKEAITIIRNDQIFSRDKILELENEKEMLRQGIRKLKLENMRHKEKMKAMQVEIKKLGGVSIPEDEDEAWNRDYDDLGRNDFILVGGKQDPFSPRYEATIKDENGLEHKSSERYYWYKMAEFFGDVEAMTKIQQATNTPTAEEISKEIKNFDEAQWKGQKLSTWESGQRLKFEQVRWIQNLLIETGKQFIAVAEQDKILGTGWRKNREEANKPIFWDGENQGGRFLMKYRKELSKSHQWAGPFEHEETQKKYGEMKKFVWRRIDMQKGPGGTTFSGPFSGRGGNGSRGSMRGTMPRRGGAFRGREGYKTKAAKSAKPFGGVTKKKFKSNIF